MQQYQAFISDDLANSYGPMKDSAIDLLNRQPTPAGFYKVVDHPDVLPLTIDEYWAVYQADEAPSGYGAFNSDWNDLNKTVMEGKWFSPPEKEYASFEGYPCTKQKTTKLESYGSPLYPMVPSSTETMLCGNSDTHLFIWEVCTNENVPYAADNKIHVVIEV